VRVGYNHFISNKGEWNNCFRKFSNRVLPPIFISTILQGGKVLNLAHYFPYDVKLLLLAHSRSFLASQKARNAIVRAENLLIADIPRLGNIRPRDAFRPIVRERKYINNSLHLARKYARIFVRGHYLFRVANSFPRA